MPNLKQATSDEGILLERFVDAFVDKPLINGSAAGILFTLLAMFDMVIASDKATFVAPF
jgi:hypothetical protein